MKDNRLNRAFFKARLITQKNAKTFYFASLFLPPQKRNAAYAVYAICRISDDGVDLADKNLRLKNLKKIAEKISLAYEKNDPGDDLLYAFQKITKDYAIPKEYFDELIEGLRMDLEKNRYHDFNELYQYCYRVAGVIGLIMLKIFDTNANKAKKFAVDLGVAMQLTNILRDIREDYKNERIYLPQQEMQRFKIDEEYISRSKLDNNFISFLSWQISRAHKYYKESYPGIKMINNRRCRLVVLMMRDIYADILNIIEKNNYNIFLNRARVPTLRKFLIAAKIITQGKYL